jgi:hypothetical protein
MYFPEESIECSSTADCFSDLKCVKGKCFREREELTEKPVDTEARISILQLFSASTYFNAHSLQ